MKRIEERIAQITAHRACCAGEHDPQHGKMHGFCVVCGVPFPCEYIGIPPAHNSQLEGERVEILIKALKSIAEAKPNTWDKDMREQFPQWAMNRAKLALENHKRGGV